MPKSKQLEIKDGELLWGAELLRKNAIYPNSDDCWNYAGSVNGEGYGNFSFNGKPILPHRWSYALFHGPIKEGELVLHKCDNPRCVNPNHLYLGTAKSNAEDREKRNGDYHSGIDWNRENRDKAMDYLVEHPEATTKETAEKFNRSTRSIRLYKKRLREQKAEGAKGARAENCARNETRKTSREPRDIKRHERPVLKSGIDEAG